MILAILGFSFLTLYALFTFAIGLLWVDWGHLGSVVFFLIWEAVMARVLFEIVQMLATILLPEVRLPRLSKLNRHPSVALLYTCRDDVIPGCLERLGDQTYPNLDIFVLDDSVLPESQALVDRCPYPTVRRRTLEGFKAGNLNHWLAKFGGRYAYFVIFDNDSLAPPEFIEELVRYAEHPANKDIAIFQSKILPWNRKSTFARWMAATGPSNMNTLSSVGNRCGTVLSFGHNNLHRTTMVQQVGGFDEQLTSEDTALTLALSAQRYRCVLIDLVSYDAEPENVFNYRRRAVRWAGQTAAVFKRPWRGAAPALKLELSRQLGNYLLNSTFLVWLAASMASLSPTAQQTLKFVHASAGPQAQRSAPVLLFWAVLGSLCVHVLLKISLAASSGARLMDVFGHLLLSSVVALFILPRVTASMLAIMLGRPASFYPSNAGPAQRVSPTAILRGMKGVWVFAALCLFRYGWTGLAPWRSFGGWWAALVILSPLILYAVQYRWKHEGKPIHFVLKGVDLGE
jgi:hypothetical protein